MPVNDAALGLMGGGPADTGAGPVGSAPQIQEATGVPPQGQASFTPTPPPPSVNSQGGAELFPRMSYAVEGVESDHKHYSAPGKVLTSSAGALGIMQVEPEKPGGTTKYGFDLTDPEQNKAAGNRELKEDFDKYGNWNDALMAYNWGQGNVDKWIAGGRTGPVPLETQRYVPAVLSRLGMSPGTEFINAREGGDKKAAALELMRGPGPTGQEEDEALTRQLLSQPPSEEQREKNSKEAWDESSSFVIGARNGLMNLVAGPIQAGLEAAAPETAKAFTQQVNSLTEPYEELLQAHPHANLSGEIVGTTVGILGAAAAGRWLAPLAVPATMATTVGMAVRSLPVALRAVGLGAALGGTSFNKDPESASRLAEAALGGTIGLLGQQVAQSVGNVLKTVSDKAVVQNFVQLLQKNYGDLEPSVSGVKTAVLSRARTMFDFRNRLYSLRNQAGEVMEGYPSGLLAEGGKAKLEGVAQVIDDAMHGRVGFDETSGQVKGVAAQLNRDLGLDKQRDALATWEAQMAEFEKAMEKFSNSAFGKQLAGMSDVSRANTLEALQRQGMNIPLPKPPAPFEAEPIQASQMAEARRTINRAIQGKRSSAARTQLGLLKKELDQTASKTAKEAGVDVATYERRQAAADKFNKEKIAPIQRVLGFKTLQEAEEHLTTAQMYEKVVKAVQGTDREAQRALYEVLGQRGREEARKALFNDMLSSTLKGAGDRPDYGAFAKYIADNRIGIDTLLGREESTRLMGLAKVAESFGKEHRNEGFIQMVNHHRWMLTFAGMAALRGAWHEATGYVGAAVGIEAIRAAMNAVQAVPRIVGPLLPRAARTTVDSPELKQIIRSIDLAMGAVTKVQSRMIPQATGGEPITSLGRIGGEIAGQAGQLIFPSR